LTLGFTLDYEKREEQLMQLKQLQKICSEYLNDDEKELFEIIIKAKNSDREIFNSLKGIYPQTTQNNASTKKCRLLKKIKNIINQIERGEK
jgi:hypothetical protein